MGFMQHQITRKQHWIQVETTSGTEFLPTDLVGDLQNSDLSEDAENDDRESLQAYCEGKVLSWENISGYGARLNAPGYMDCTEWDVFDSEDEAESYLNEMYGEDEDSEEN